jgi:hypothetical protein
MTKPIELAAVKTRSLNSLRGNHGLLGPMLYQNEDKGQRDAPCEQSHAVVRTPTPRDAAETGKEDEEGGCTGKREGTEVVNRVAHAPQRPREYCARDEEGEDAERQIDIEDPSPREVRNAESADERANDRGHTEHGAEEPHVATPVAG